MNIALQRLANQTIDTPKYDNPADVVRWMGAMQAQDYAQALWAIGLRTKNAHRSTVEAAIAKGSILRTWPMRGTIHFVPAEDAQWMLSLSAPKLIAADGRRMAQLELTDAAIDTCAQILHDALHNQPPMARPKVMKLFEERGIVTKGQRGYHILWRLALAGLICIGPMEGKQQTFAWLSDWAPRQTSYHKDEALAELAWRYIRSHGPATVEDFATWTGQNITSARQAFAAIDSKTASFTSEGRQYFHSKDMPTPAKRGRVHLLPGFDEYLLGYKDRRDMLHADHAMKVVPGGNGIFKPMIVVDGQIAGIWSRTIKPKHIDVETQHFATLTANAQKAINRELDRFSTFMNLPIRRP